MLASARASGGTAARVHLVSRAHQRLRSALHLPLPKGEIIVGVLRNVGESLSSLLMLFIVFLIVTFPVTWLLMLFLGNIGANLSYWGTLPLGTVVSLVIGASSSSAYKY
jgi:Na+-driven multidrug efflux pump